MWSWHQLCSRPLYGKEIRSKTVDGVVQHHMAGQGHRNSAFKKMKIGTMTVWHWAPCTAAGRGNCCEAVEQAFEVSPST